MSLFDGTGLGPSPRGKGRIQAVKGSLMSLESNQVGGTDYRKKKIKDRRPLRGWRGNPTRPITKRSLELGDLAGEPANNPNEMTEVVVRLPLGMIVAAGEHLDELAYEGIRAGLAKRGITWFGPRFLVRLEATRMRRAEAKRKFTL